MIVEGVSFGENGLVAMMNIFISWRVFVLFYLKEIGFNLHVKLRSVINITMI